MTDLQVFLAFYKQVGINMEKGRQPNEANLVFYFGGDPGLGMPCAQSRKFDGYGGFYSSIEFTKEGKFIRQGFWE